MSAQTVLLPLSIVLLACQLQYALTGLVIEPVKLAVEPGWDAQLSCSWAAEENSTKIAALTWHRLQQSGASAAAASLTGEVILTNSSNVEVVDGRLTIRNASFTDAGEYQCRDDTGSVPAGATIIVYEMPSYAREGAIIAGVAVALLVLLLIGFAFDYRKRQRMYLAKQKQQHQRGEVEL